MLAKKLKSFIVQLGNKEVKLRKVFITAITATLLSALFVGTAHAELRITVDKSDQMMYVEQDGRMLYEWKVSTGRKDSWTPNGTFSVQSLSKNHRSSIYGNAPMPYSVFFNGNVAIHGTTEPELLGQRASHGCVRLKTEHAAMLFRMVQEDTRVRIAVRS